MKKADFLFEIGCEELPSAAVLDLSQSLVENVEKLFLQHGLTYSAIQSFATPRRLAVYVKELVSQQPDQMISRRGPSLAAAYGADNKPTPALTGFAKSCGVDIAQLLVIPTDKGEWLYFESTQPGMATAQLLPTIMAEAIASLPVAKPMHWGNGEFAFARPIHWLLMLYGTNVISMALLGVNSGQFSYGHRFHHPEALMITHPGDYESSLLRANVVVDFKKRRQLVRDQVEKIAQQCQAEAIIPDALLDEVTSIVEWPNALLVPFEKTFLTVPKEVLIACMQSHQKCFALQDRSANSDTSQNLLPYFITVANITSQNEQQVIMGNEKVMRARLSDAAFFYAQDRKTTLATQVPATQNVIFQAKLGSLFDKAERIKWGLQVLLSPMKLNEAEANRAACLSKCDLMTGMVGEFPELQGLMGYYYALYDGESPAVAQALNEQYMPRFSGDVLPTSALGTALSLADRLDTLTGAFILGQKPSGVKDPFKLRRHALAVVRLLLNTPLELSLATLIDHAAAPYQNLRELSKTSQLSELKTFILERLLGFYQNQGISSHWVNAALACQDDCLYDFNLRLQALIHFTTLPAAEFLAAACKRVNNLLSSAAVDFAQLGKIEPTLLQETAEKQLVHEMNKVEAQLEEIIRQEPDYQTMLTLLSGLYEAVDAFFEHVMVLVDDEQIKRNRLALLYRLRSLLRSVADISLL